MRGLELRLYSTVISCRIRHINDDLQLIHSDFLTYAVLDLLDIDVPFLEILCKSHIFNKRHGNNQIRTNHKLSLCC